MASQELSFRRAVVTGGGHGMGRSMLESLAAQNPNLQTAENWLKHGTPHYVLDTADIFGIPSSIKKMTAEYLNVDCPVSNVGVK